MARPRSSLRSKARKMYMRSGKTLKNKVIAQRLGVSPSLVAKWKCIDQWGNPALPKEPSKSNKRGAPKGNKNAVGNIGGGAPIFNRNAWKHGAYSMIGFGLTRYTPVPQSDGRVLWRRKGKPNGRVFGFYSAP